MSEKRKKISIALKFLGITLILAPIIFSEIESFFRTVPKNNIIDTEEIKKAEDYNKKYLSGRECVKYDDVLNFENSGIMGSISIPSIRLKAPIRHGTSEIVLRDGIGHVKSTTLPVGGKGGRPILTGHRGLPGRNLFLRLD